MKKLLILLTLLSSSHNALANAESCYASFSSLESPTAIELFYNGHIYKEFNAIREMEMKLSIHEIVVKGIQSTEHLEHMLFYFKYLNLYTKSLATVLNKISVDGIGLDIIPLRAEIVNAPIKYRALDTRIFHERDHLKEFRNRSVYIQKQIAQYLLETFNIKFEFEDGHFSTSTLADLKAQIGFDISNSALASSASRDIETYYQKVQMASPSTVTNSSTIELDRNGHEREIIR